MNTCLTAHLNYAALDYARAAGSVQALVGWNSNPQEVRLRIEILHGSLLAYFFLRLVFLRWPSAAEASTQTPARIQTCEKSPPTCVERLFSR